MNFRTIIDIPKSAFPLKLSDEVVLLGSCFADNIGKRMTDSKFRVLCNPFGTLYNPESIAWLIEKSLNSHTFNENSAEIFHDGIYWHSWMHHSTFSSTSAVQLMEKMNQAGQALLTWLTTARTLIVTFGTATIYELNAGGRLVANCHKQPDNLFHRRMLTVEEIKQRWLNIIGLLSSFNDKIKVVFTVSPIRHRRDGFHRNQLSKATLLLAVEEIIKDASSAIHVDYFPAYEIMMDELRDYRFYADDMIHPSEMAVNYIWERFADTNFTEADKKVIQHLCTIKATLAHIPANPHAENYQALIRKTVGEINELTKQYPYLDMENEIALCNTKLEK